MLKKDLKTSEILQSLEEDALHLQKITLGELIERLGYRVYGLGILIFALPSIVPLSAIPGVAAFFSLPIMLLSLQLIFSKKEPWLPKWLMSKSIETAHLKKLFHYAIPYLQKIEKLIKPRYPFFSKKIVEIFVGLLIAWLSILLMLPIPFSNMLFGALIAVLALGLIEKDGLIILIGLLIGGITAVLYIQAFNLLITWLF
jgi:hypothetical protein